MFALWIKFNKRYKFFRIAFSVYKYRMTAAKRSIRMHTNDRIFSSMTWAHVRFGFIFILKNRKIESRRRECSDKSHNRLEIALTSAFCKFNKITEWFICSHISSGSSSNIGNNNGQHVNLKFESERQITVNEMKCVRTENVSIFFVDEVVDFFVLFGTLWAWWDNWLSLFFHSIWLEHVIVDAAATVAANAAAVANPAHIYRIHSFVRIVTDLFERHSQITMVCFASPKHSLTSSTQNHTNLFACVPSRRLVVFGV